MYAPKFKPTRLAHGTLRIRVDADPTHDMLLDKAVIAASCPTLEPVLRALGSTDARHCWGKSELFKVSGKDDPVEIWSLAINLVDGAYILDGDSLRPDTHGSATPFQNSELSEPEWKDIDSRCNYDGDNSQAWREIAVHQHHIMFRMLHKFPVCIEDIPNAVFDDEDQGSSDYICWGQLVGWLSEFCARAEYYGCLPKLVDQVVDLMAGEASLWKAVALEPWQFLLLGAKLRCSNLFFDALRHLLVCPRKFYNHHNEIAEMLNVSKEQLDNLRDRAMTNQKEAVRSLSVRLRQIQLSTHWKRLGWDDNGAIRTTMMNKLKLQSIINMDKEIERAGFIARSIYAEWLAQQEVGEEAYRNNYGRQDTVSRSAGPFARSVAEIQQHANAAEPAHLFGADAAGKHMELLGGDCSEEAIKAVHVALSHIVLHANDIIENVFQHKTEIEAGGQILTYSRTCWDRGFPVDYEPSVFTYIGWDEWETPWKDKAKWDCNLTVAPVSGAAARAPLLQALGMFVCKDLLDPEEDADEDDVLRSLYEDDGFDLAWWALASRSPGGAPWQ